jgi:hypothetical protein
MEKLIYTLWKRPGESAEAWADRLRGPLGERLIGAGARTLQVDVVDEVVASGSGLRLESRPVPDGFVALWMDSANFRAAAEQILAEAHAKIAGYLVTESLIKNDTPPTPPGSRSYGFSLIGFLQRPVQIERADWLKIWLGSHTQVAVETQPTFRYVQNVVTRTLTEDAPVLDALVEEGFPAAALTDPAAFYDAVGDEAKHKHNHQRMMDSCHRFIDFAKIDSLPMSEFMV